MPTATATTGVNNTPTPAENPDETKQKQSSDTGSKYPRRKSLLCKHNERMQRFTAKLQQQQLQSQSKRAEPMHMKKVNLKLQPNNDILTILRTMGSNVASQSSLKLSENRQSLDNS